MSAKTEIPSYIAELTGPLVLGHFFNWALFGVLTVQTYVYYLAFPRDRWAPKTVVSTLYTIEVLQIVLATKDAFRNFGSAWGDFDNLDQVGLLWFSVPVLGSIIASIAQFFFAWRIWILSHQWYIPVVVALLSITQCVAGIWSGIHSHIIGVFSEIPSHTFVSTSVWLGGTALCDLVIAASMIIYLNQSRTGFRSTNVILSKFVRLTIETGAICATFAVFDLTFFLVFRHNNYHLVPSIPLSKLYSNCLLVVLNARMRFVNGRDTSIMFEDISLSAISTDFRIASNFGNHNETGTISVSRETRTEYDPPRRDEDLKKGRQILRDE